MRNVTLVAMMMIFTELFFTGTGLPAEEETLNLLPYTFQDANKDGFPDGFTKYDALEGKLTYDPSLDDKKNGPAVRLELLQSASVRLDLTTPVKLENHKRYLFTLEVKVKDLQRDMSSEIAVRAVRIYVYGMKDHHVWTEIVAEGKKSTEGWIRAMLPFDTGADPKMTSVQLLLRPMNVSGTVWFRNPALVELPDFVQMQTYFLQWDGSAVPGTTYVIP